MKRALFHYRARGFSLAQGPWRLLVTLVPDRPMFGYGRIATSGRGPAGPCGDQCVVDHRGVALVLAGVCIAVLRRTGVTFT